MNQGYHLYVISFTVGSEAGLAMVAAQDDKSAFQILKNGGSRNHEGYRLMQIRDLGMTANCSFGLLIESFVNAKEAFDAITSVANYMKGEKGDDGAPGPVGPEGPQGRDGASVIGIDQTVISHEDDGWNEVTFTLADGTISKAYVKNGSAGVTEAFATIDGTQGTPRVVTNITDGVLSFAFTGLKGMQGNPGVNNATMIVVESLPTASEYTAEKIYLIYNDETDEYDRYFTQYDGSTYSWVQAGSMSVDLEDYQRKDDEVWLTQDEFDALTVKDITKVYNIYEEAEEP
jgi:hypothetical protein